MIKHYAHHVIEPKYLIVYRVLKINESTLLLVTPNGRECTMNDNNVQPASTLKLIKKAWDSFLKSIQTNHQNHDYNLRSHS